MIGLSLAMSPGNPLHAMRPLNSFSPFKDKIMSGAEDVTLMFIGDSRGNSTSESLYLFVLDLAAAHPTHTVNYYLVNQTTFDAYDAPSTVQTGSGARMINVYNASVAGSSPSYFLGSKRAAIIDAVTPDLVIWNHGTNTSNVRGEMMMGIDPVRAQYPNANHVLTLLYPNRDDNNATARYTPIVELAGDYGDMRAVDYYSPTIAAGKPAEYYADNVHMDADGNEFLRPYMISAYRSARRGAYLPAVPGLSINGTNLLTDGHFDTLMDSGDAGSDWNLLSSPTVAVESTIKPADATRSMKLTGTTAGGRIQQAVSAEALATAKADGYVTLGAKLFVPIGSAESVGRIALTQGGTGAVSETMRIGAIQGKGGWIWSFLTLPVASTITSLTAVLYCDSAVNTDSTVYYETAIMVAGKLPRDLA